MAIQQIDLKRQKIERELSALNMMLEQEGIKTRYKLIEQTKDNDNA